ncbi:carboxypeptidase S [Punctularia strigosozonata HHB-11173 SS5]|uniref:Carboxypeptidase S n=1 Tax=Punctularia strigosozonata (strain HHB-11173) TaxID=741275 RepID=R7S4C7_PUNST|nr:carboxypeptidase S [Punctularia strigosozonata HHB-11173 SS5]EIN04704.1 carboxypeptidase S [Punctularia strigosozonata HHB-11173 SS5]
MKDDAKDLLSQAEDRPALVKTRTRRGVSPRILLCLVLCAVLALLPRLVHQRLFSSRLLLLPDSLVQGTCPQVGAIFPAGPNGELWGKLSALYAQVDYEERAVAWLSDAVRIPTELYDDMGLVGEDERWEAFRPFNEYLVEAFPRIHSTVKLTKVNTYGLLYEWLGTDADLKPLLLMAHSDVVPVDPATADQWAHPPYSGHFDGERIWGRGSSDDKNGLIAAMAVIETLLEHDFQPRRTIIMSFGFDEEGGGPYSQGAQALANLLLDRYGKDAFAMIIDEGSGYVEQFGTVFAIPAIGEKGYANVHVEVKTPGGHSSIPPAHTSIGILSSLLVHLESNQENAHLIRTEPLYQYLQCVAEHAPDVSRDLRTALVKGRHSDRALREAEKIVFQDAETKALAGTTQAVDVIYGGVKSNALPEQAAAIVNHRIATDSSLGAMRARYIHLLAPLAAAFNLSYTAFGTSILGPTTETLGELIVTNPDGLEPAPTVPTDPGAKPFALLSGTIRATYAKRREALGGAREVLVAPGIISGNTDTVYYWDLSAHIFRYNHNDLGTGGLGNIHTVNESMGVESFMEEILFFTTLILNADDAELL